MYGVPPPTLTFWILGWRALLSCGSGALFDWARGLDGVYCCHDDFFAPQPRPLCCCFRLVTVVVVTKSRSPKVGSPT